MKYQKPNLHLSCNEKTDCVCAAGTTAAASVAQGGALKSCAGGTWADNTAYSCSPGSTDNRWYNICNKVGADTKSLANSCGSGITVSVADDNCNAVGTSPSSDVSCDAGGSN